MIQLAPRSIDSALANFPLAEDPFPSNMPNDGAIHLSFYWEQRQMGGRDDRQRRVSLVFANFQERCRLYAPIPTDCPVNTIQRFPLISSKSMRRSFPLTIENMQTLTANFAILSQDKTKWIVAEKIQLTKPRIDRYLFNSNYRIIVRSDGTGVVIQDPPIDGTMIVQQKRDVLRLLIKIYQEALEEEGERIVACLGRQLLRTQMGYRWPISRLIEMVSKIRLITLRELTIRARILEAFTKDKSLSSEQALCEKFTDLCFQHLSHQDAMDIAEIILRSITVDKLSELDANKVRGIAFIFAGKITKKAGRLNIAPKDMPIEPGASCAIL